MMGKTKMSNSIDHEISAFIQRIPKTETHLHMEGALPFSLLQELDGDTFSRPPASWAPDFKFATFKQFENELLSMALRWYTSAQRYHESARMVFQQLVEQNVKYVETSFHAGIVELHGIPGPDIVAAIRAAVPAGLEVRVFMGMLRDHYNEAMAPVLDDCVHWEDLDGIDLHGVEVLPIQSWTERLWARARAAGLETKAHAGEFGGPENVREVMERLGVKRVQHGIRAIEDPEVVRMAIDQDATFDTCPISNVKLNVVPTMRDHPVRALFDHGVRCTVSTDDPLSFGNRLVDEYEELYRYHFNRGELAQLARNGFEVALMTEEQKSPYIEELDHLIATGG